MRNLFPVCLIVFILSISLQGTCVAQSSTVWSPEANLSHSGAAAQPRLVTAPDGKAQVFWWDRFDGLVTTFNIVDSNSDLVWSEPVASPILSTSLSGTPTIVLDAYGWIHAFWTETEQNLDSDFAGAAVADVRLMHSELAFGESIWAFPEILAESIAGYTLATPPLGGMTVAYIRNKHTADAPAGVYVKHNYGHDDGWGLPSLVYASIYLRLTPPDQAQISLLDNNNANNENEHTMYVAWFDQRREEILVAASGNSGKTWSEVQSLGADENLPVNPRLASNGKVMLIWQASAQGGCVLYQQELLLNDQNSSGEGLLLNLGSPHRILEDRSECPQNDRFINEQDRPFWLWNEGGSNLSLAVWDPAQDLWSQTINLSFSFEDPVSLQSVNLNEIHLSTSENTIQIVGTDNAGGEIWFTQAEVSALELTFAAPSPWLPAQMITPKDTYASVPDMVLDDQSRTHLIWSQAIDSTHVSNSLHYASFADGNLSRAVEIVPVSTGEIARQPALWFEPANSMLHLTWSGGKDGALLYSRVNINEAGSAAAWFARLILAHTNAAAWPQIGQDAHGSLYVLYVISLNEQRGVYLVRSQNSGTTWSDPILVFGALSENWGMVDHPSLEVGADGTLYAAWVHATLPGLGAPLGIFYSLSRDGGDSWTPPITLTGSGYDWPQLLLSGGKVHLIYANSGNGNGSLYHRWAEIQQPSEESSTWSVPLSIPGWKDIALPFGATASGPREIANENSASAIHLAGAKSATGTLLYSSWNGERWSAAEVLNESGQIKEGTGVSTATRFQGGELAVGWAGQAKGSDHASQMLFMTVRNIPAVEITTADPTPPEINTTPTIGSMLIPEPTKTLTPTPNLNAIPPSQSGSQSNAPLIWGGILAAIVVVGIFAGKMLFGRSGERAR